MGGPVGLGVFDAIRKARARRGAEPRPARPPEWTLFLVVTVLLSWVTALIIGGRPQLGDEPVGVHLFWASAYYAAVMGWQPLVGAHLARRLGRRRLSNGGIRRPRAVDVGVAAGLGIGLVGAAALVAWALGESAPAGGGSVPGAADWAPATAALLLLLAQAATEEYGWRGYPLAAAQRRWGARRGLLLHGLAWGAWYAPLFLLPTDDPRGAMAGAAGFALTCGLLGVVLAWLRLRSHSVVPPVIANVVITLAAGLPMLLYGASGGVQDAVLRWPGWPVLGVAAVLLLVWRSHEIQVAPGTPPE